MIDYPEPGTLGRPVAHVTLDVQENVDWKVRKPHHLTTPARIATWTVRDNPHGTKKRLRITDREVHPATLVPDDRKSQK